jgi:hypothetical protein
MLRVLPSQVSNLRCRFLVDSLKVGDNGFNSRHFNYIGQRKENDKCKTKIKMGITGWESCHTEGRKNVGGKWNRGASG